MTPREFAEKAFGIEAGTIDVKLGYPLLALRYEDRVSELEYACGTDRDTFFALNAFATCPRSYMLRYLWGKPLSVPFYEQVHEVVREVLADEAMGRIRREELPAKFAELYDGLVKGPFPIHRSKVNWPESWKLAVGGYLKRYNPEWERRGWRVKGAYVPVSVIDEGRQVKGNIDLLLENGKGEYAIVVHDSGSTIYRAKMTGKITETIESARDIQDLKRKAYVYGKALVRSFPEYDGKLCEIILSLYKPKSKNPFEMVLPWREDECSEALHWMGRVLKLIRQAGEDRDWPAAELLRTGNGGRAEPDKNYCQERCTSCQRCRWAAYHPEELKAFTDVTKVTVLPQKYIGMKIRLRDGLDKKQRILSFQETVTLPDGRSGGTSKFKSVVQKMGLEVIGDLEGRRISDFFGTVGCGELKLELILRLFYDVHE